MGAVQGSFEKKASNDIVKRFKVNQRHKAATSTLTCIYKQPLTAELRAQRDKAISLVKNREFVAALESLDFRELESDLERIVLLFEILGRIDSYFLQFEQDKGPLDVRLHSFRSAYRDIAAALVKRGFSSTILAKAVAVEATHKLLTQSLSFMFTAELLNSDFLSAGGLAPLMTLIVESLELQYVALVEFRYRAVTSLMTVLYCPGGKQLFLSAKPVADISQVARGRSLQQIVMEEYLSFALEGLLDTGDAFFCRFASADAKLHDTFAAMALSCFDGKLLDQLPAALTKQPDERCAGHFCAVRLAGIAIRSRVGALQSKMLPLLEPLARLFTHQDAHPELYIRAFSLLEDIVTIAFRHHADGSFVDDGVLLSHLLDQPEVDSGRCAGKLIVPIPSLSASANEEQRELYHEACELAASRCKATHADKPHLHFFEWLAALTTHSIDNIGHTARCMLAMLRCFLIYCDREPDVEDVVRLATLVSSSLFGSAPAESIANDLLGPLVDPSELLRRAEDPTQAIVDQKRGSQLRKCAAPGCGKSEADPGVKLMMCSRCRIARYCSKECLKKAWPVHKNACRPAEPSSKLDYKREAGPKSGKPDASREQSKAAASNSESAKPAQSQSFDDVD